MASGSKTEWTQATWPDFVIFEFETVQVIEMK